ncbi:MAG: histidine phosphatase family protein [Thiotrichales bacterium]|nr:MAG: histidine phosphatase family protein [Thiotrichales bacterium]
MRAIVVRHYKTTSNESDQILGWGDAPPAASWMDDLNKVEQILLASQFTIHHIYTSTLPRAINTGKFYADSYAIKDIFSSPALREVNYGKLYNKSKKWVERHIPKHKKDPDFVYPNGESFKQMQDRSVAFIQSLAQKHPDETLLVVVHAGVIRGLVCHCLGLDYASNLKRQIGHQYIGDFTIEGDTCVRYNELGRPSEFVREGIVKVPYYISEPAAIDPS